MGTRGMTSAQIDAQRTVEETPPPPDTDHGAESDSESED